MRRGGGYDAPALTTQSSETNGITDGDSVAYLVYSGEADTAPETKTLPAGEYTLLNDASAPTEWGGETGTEYWYVAEGKVMLPERVNVTGDVHLVLADDCWLDITNEKSGGINVSAGSSLTIYAQSTDEDKMGILVAAGQESCAGIGGGNGQNGGTVTIHGGSVDVMGGKYAAGIGGGDGSSSGGGGGGDGSSSGGGSGGTVMIYGGNVQTTGGSYAAGIGGGMYGSGGSIAIYGGTVTAATSGKGAAAGIGGGDSGSGGTITITGGTVVADGSGAGIGGNADGSDGGSVTITGGTVVADGSGAGIGGSVSTVTIKGGTVEAKSNSKGVAIGTRDYLAGEMKVYIEAGHVTANGGSSSAGIGNGNGGYASAHVFISGGTVDATGGSFGAGIGGGLSGTGGNTVTITGGTVVATGGDYAAGIGGGYNGKSVAVTISGGIVTATGGSNAAGVGNGESGSGATFSTGTDGHALLVASSISDKDDTSAWSGIIFEGAEGKVYGDVTLPAGEYPVPAGSTLTIPCGSTLTGAGTLTSDGTATFITENLTEDMIRVPDGIVAGDPDLSETLLDTLKENITQDLEKQTVTLCGQDFALSGWTVADVEAKAGDATNRTYTVTCTYDGTPAQTLAAEITLPLSLASATVTLAQDTYTYDGNEKKPSVTVTLADGTKLTEGTDYTVTYTDNVNAGTATVTVTGMGSYAGEAKETFTINKAKLATPTSLSWKSGTGYPAAQWNAVENAAENVRDYLVYVYECNADGTRKENVDWTAMGVLNPTLATGADGRASYECSTMQAGKHYTFTVQALSSNANYIDSDVAEYGGTAYHEHDRTGTPVWSWAEDYGSATAVLTCTGCGTVLYTNTATKEDGNITSEVTTAPTCEEPGARTYTATLWLGGNKHTNTNAKTEEIPATGHSWGAWSDNGDGTHTRACDYCGKTETAAHDYDAAGKCQVCGAQAVASVASTGDATAAPVYYTSFADAWTAAKGDANGVTLTLLQDVTANAALTVEEKDNITLTSAEKAGSTNGYTLSGSIDKTDGGLITVTGGSLTLTGGTVENDENGSNAIAVARGSTGRFVLDGGAVIARASGDSGVCVYGGTAEFKSGSASGYYGIANVGATSFVISGGTYTRTYTDTISAAIFMRGEGNVKSLLADGMAYYEGADTTGDRISNLTGQSLTGTVTVAACNAHSWTASMDDGAHHTLACIYCNTTRQEAHTFGPDGHCTAAGCTAQAAASVTVDGATKQYGTLQEAWTAAKESETAATVTLLADAEVSEALTVEGNDDITLDSKTKDVENNVPYTISGNVSAIIRVSGGSLTLKNGNVAGREARSYSDAPAGIQVTGGTFYMEGGSVSGYTALAIAGGEIYISGGSLTSNDPLYGGYGIDAAGGKIELTGGTYFGRDFAIISYDSEVREVPVGDLLGEGCSYMQDGVWVSDTTPNGLTGTITVVPAPIRKVTVTGQNTTVTYGYAQDAAPTLTAKAELGSAAEGSVTYQWYQITGETTSEAISGATGATYTPTGLDAGEYTYTCTATATATDGSYSRTSDAVTVTVDPASLADAVVTLFSTSVEYNGWDKEVIIQSVTLNGTDLVLDKDYIYSGTDGKNAGTYTVTVTGKGNYTGTAKADWVITPKELKVYVYLVTKEYDGTADITQGTLDSTKYDFDGLITGDEGKVTLDASGVTAQFADANAGERKSITCTGSFALTGEAAGNYKLAYQPSLTGTITPRPITVTPTAGQTKEYGAADPVLTYDTGEGQLLDGHTVTLTRSDRSEAVGEYAIDTCTITDAAQNNVTANYAVALTAASFTITAPSLANAEVTLGLPAGGYTYDGSAKTPEVAVTKNGATLTKDTDYTVTYTGTDGTSYGSTTAPTNAGTYTVTVTAAQTGNYTDSKEAGSFTISPAKLAAPKNLSWGTDVLEIDVDESIIVPTTQWDAVEGAERYVGYIFECDANGKIAEGAEPKCEMTVGAGAADANGRVSTIFVDAEAGKYYTFTVQAVPDSNDPNHSASDVVQYSGAPLHEHNWKITWQWNNAHTSADAVLACTGCGEALHATATKESGITETVTKAATCEEPGEQTYTATVTLNGTEYTDTQTVETAKLGHIWDDGVWTWSEDGKAATLTFTCQRDSKHTETPTVTVTTSTTNATCTEAGTITYTATATFGGETYTDHKTTTGAALGHDWGEPEWKWADDYSSVTGTFTCERCHTTATVSASGDEIKTDTTPATCEQDGKIVYSASVTFNNKSYEATAAKTIDKLGHTWSDWAKTAAPTEDSEGEETRTCSVCGKTETRPIPALGHTHTWGAPVWSWAAGGESATATFTCTKNEAHTQVIEAEITEIEAERQEPTETTSGQAVYEAAVNFEGQDYTDRKTVRLPATGTLVPDDEKTRLDVQELSDADIPAGLRETKFNTAETITREMTRVLAEEMQTDAANTVVHDVRLQVLRDGDWVDVHEDDFPAGGVAVTLPYPDGTGPQTHTYVVTHMLSSGADAGKVEVLREGERVTKTAEGLRFTVYSLSPIGVAWTETPAQPETPAASGSDGDVEAFIGAAVVIGGGAALLAYHYREDLPIWKLAGVVTLAAADGTADAAGAPVANATVTLYQSGEAVKTLTTDAHGLFETRMPKGTYEAVVTWEKDGVVYTARKEVVAESVLDDGAVQQIALQAAQPQA